MTRGGLAMNFGTPLAVGLAQVRQLAVLELKKYGMRAPRTCGILKNRNLTYF